MCGVSPEVHLLHPRLHLLHLVPRRAEVTRGRGEVTRGRERPRPSGQQAGVSTGVAAYPPFPPRTVPTFCALAGDAPGGKHWPRVATVEESSLRRERAVQWLRSQACLCNYPHP